MRGFYDILVIYLFRCTRRALDSILLYFSCSFSDSHLVLGDAIILATLYHELSVVTSSLNVTIDESFVACSSTLVGYVGLLPNEVLWTTDSSGRKAVR